MPTGNPEKPYKKQLDPHPRLNCRGKYTDVEFNPDEVQRRMLPINKTDAVGLDTRFIAQVDIDNAKGIDADALKWMYDNCPYFLSMSSRLPHFFIKIEQQPWKRGKKPNKNGHMEDCIENPTTKVNMPDSKETAADILHGQWSYMKTDEELLNPHLAGNIPSFLTAEAVKDFIRFKSPNIQNMCIAAAPPSASVLCTAKPKTTIQKPQQTPSNEVDTSLQQPSAIDDIVLFIKELKQEHTDHDEGRTFKTMAWSLKSHAGDKYKDDMMCAGKQSSYAKHDYDEWFNRLWLFNLDGQVPKPITIGSFYFLVRKLLGDEIYCKIKTKSFTPSCNIDAYRVACDFENLNGDDWVFHQEERFMFNGFVWKKDTKKGLRFQKSMHDSMALAYTSLKNEAEMKSVQGNSEQRKAALSEKTMYEALLTKVPGGSFKLECVGHFDTLIFAKTDEDMEWDTNFDTFYFKDCVFDLKTGEQIQPDKSHHVTITTGFNYIKPTPEQINKVIDLFKKTLPVDEERELYLHLIASGLIGRQMAYINIINGSGGNGKSAVHGLMRALCGNYYRELNTSTVTQLQKTELNNDLNQMHNKRFVIAAEPEDQSSLKIGMVKNITGNPKINSRGNYVTNTVVNVTATLFIECNKKPNLDGRMDDSVHRRVMDVPFRSTFKDDPTKHHGDHIFKKDLSFVAPEFSTEHRCALFHVLLPYVQKLYALNLCIDSIVPQSIKDRNLEYMADSDDFKTWLDEHYERVGDDYMYVQAKDMYNVYKETLFLNLSKKQCRDHTKKWFCRELQTNFFTKTDFKETYRKTVNGVQLYVRQVLVGWRKRSLPHVLEQSNV